MVCCVGVEIADGGVSNDSVEKFNFSDWSPPYLGKDASISRYMGVVNPLSGSFSTGSSNTGPGGTITKTRETSMTTIAEALATQGITNTDLDEIVERILAGRCVEEHKVPDDLESRVKDDLLNGMQNPEIQLRARIAASHTLGRLGDPRFEVVERTDNRFITPNLIRVPGGTYPIGSTQQNTRAEDSERPRHNVRIEDFNIGQYPVTVGEYRCFVEAGGYEQEQYWETSDAKSWLRGDDPAGGPIGRILGLRQRLLDSDRSLDDWAEEHHWKPQTLQSWQKWTAMSESEVRQDFHTIVPAHSRAEPVWWNDASRTGSNQPVVGVTWYEARAYCAWLTEVTARPFRLPTEVEWEAAVRGQDGRRYPWGKRFDPARANTLEGQVQGTTPVGMYPGGVSPFGVWDGAGNVWEWTSSIFRQYPYQPDDDREDEASSDNRILRGGSWFSDKGHCRCAFRDVTIPDLYSHYVGFRVASSCTPHDG